MQIYQTRKDRLRQLIDDRYGHRASRFCTATGENSTYISRIFKGTKPFTENIARRIEIAAGVKKNWLDGSGDSEPVAAEPTLDEQLIRDAITIIQQGHVSNNLAETFYGIAREIVSANQKNNAHAIHQQPAPYIVTGTGKKKTATG